MFFRQGMSVGKFVSLVNGSGGVLSTAYADLIADTFGANVVAHWPSWEKTGVTAEDYSPNNLDGTYRNIAGVLNGVTLGQAGIGDGRTGVAFDGVNGYTNVYTVGLRDAFDGAEGTLIAWFKVDADYYANNKSGVIVSLSGNGNNLVQLAVSAVGGVGRITAKYFAGVGANNLTTIMTSVSDTIYVPFALTWSKSNDRFIPYFKGVQVAATVTGLGVWSANLSSTLCAIGAIDTTPTAPFLGQVAHVILLDREATSDEIAAVSHPNGIVPWSVTSWSIPQGAANTPAVMMTFDDEYESVYTEGFSRMEPLDLRGTFYVMTNAIDGVNDPPYITSAELIEMDAAGWSIANHTTDQTTLSEVDIPTATAKIADAKTVLDGMGLARASMHLSYPNGGWDADVTTAAIAAGMLTGRRITTVPTGYPDYVPANNYVIWSTMRLGGGTKPVQIMNAIDAAIAAGKTILFYGHKIVEPADDTTKIEPWVFQVLLNYCGLKNLPFLTINDYYDLQSGAKVITRSP